MNRRSCPGSRHADRPFEVEGCRRRPSRIARRCLRVFSASPRRSRRWALKRSSSRVTASGSMSANAMPAAPSQAAAGRVPRGPARDDAGLETDSRSEGGGRRRSDRSPRRRAPPASAVEQSPISRSAPGRGRTPAWFDRHTPGCRATAGRALRTVCERAVTEPSGRDGVKWRGAVHGLSCRGNDGTAERDDYAKPRAARTTR